MRSILSKVKKLLKAINFENLKSIFRYIKNHGFKGLFSACIARMRGAAPTVANEYETWMKNNEPDKKRLLKQAEYRSLQSIKFAIFCVSENRELIDSINLGTYKNYEILPFEKLSEPLPTDCDYILLVGENIVLAPFALFELTEFIEKGNYNFIYCDNDKLIDGKREAPHFKPDFAVDTLLSQDYIGDFIAIKTAFLKSHSGISENLTPRAEIYNLTLRTAAETSLIGHIPKILYHETVWESPVDTAAQKRAIAEYLGVKNLEFDEIENGLYDGQYKIDYKIIGSPTVSLVVPNMDHTDDLRKLLQSIKKSKYENYEVVIVENNSRKPETFEFYKKIQSEDKRIKVVDFKIDYFNYSAIVNFGVENSSGEYVVLLNNDIEFLTDDFIERMLMFAQRKDVGICGAKLYFPDKTIQHAGVTIGTRGLAGHRFREMSPEEYHKFDYINIVQNLSAVTAACFMVSRKIYNEVLGFDEKLAVAFNDVDFCLKVRELGYLIVYNPYVEAYHYESKSRGEDTENSEKQKRFANEYAMFVKKWSAVIGKGDPYYNKNYRLDTDLPKINYNVLNL